MSIRAAGSFVKPAHLEQRARQVSADRLGDAPGPIEAHEGRLDVALYGVSARPVMTSSTVVLREARRSHLRSAAGSASPARTGVPYPYPSGTGQSPGERSPRDQGSRRTAYLQSRNGRGRHPLRRALNVLARLMRRRRWWPPLRRDRSAVSSLVLPSSTVACRPPRCRSAPAEGDRGFRRAAAARRLAQRRARPRG
jgi:hypothetical protein